MRFPGAPIVLASLTLAATASPSRAQNAAPVDFTHAVIVTSPKASAVERQAARMLVEEAARRSGVTLRGSAEAQKPGAPAIYLGSRERPPTGSAPLTKGAKPGPEGYTLRAAGATVFAIGADERGCMFAAGRLLRVLQCSPGSLRMPAIDLTTTPANRLRGHQLGWRPTANSYDRWGLAEFEQYIRDLVVWGTNAIELIPFDSTYPRGPNTRFTCQLADLIHSYGLQVWLWYPLDDTTPIGVTGDGLAPGSTPCPSRADGRKFILDRRKEFFQTIKHLDAVFIPGGDPAGCSCDQCKPWVRTMLPLCEQIAGLLHQSHPKAQMWLSNQGFRGEDNREFYRYLQEKRPKWLAGLVAGPWAEETIADMRAHAPASYPIRLYPDICHCVRCQYPAKEWDQAYASTLGREPAIYRPTEHAHIATMYQPLSCGAITYSDGVTDDLNKVVWSARLWDPKASVDSVLTDYGRVYFGEGIGAEVARGLRGLERDWKAPLSLNADVAKTSELWTGLEAGADETLRGNWRFQMALTRAVYDRYVQRRLAADTAVEQEVYRVLRAAGDDEASLPKAVADGLEVLERANGVNPESETRDRLLVLGQALYDSIGMQLSVKRWGASGSERGAVMDYLEVPLANQEWLRAELLKLRALSSTPAIRAGVRRILEWEEPGPGGFYDDLGNPTRQPHLVHQKPWADDPGYVESPRCDFAQPFPGARQTWTHYAETLYGKPLVMRYEGLDANAQYVVRATYTGRYKPTMTLTANGRYPVHGPVKAVTPPTTWTEWQIPREATKGGTLELRWDLVEGRGCQVAEVWLMKR